MRLRQLLVPILIAFGAADCATSAQAATQVRSVEYSGSFSYRISDYGPNGSSVQTRTLSWVMTLYDDGRAVHKSFIAQGSESIVFGDGSGDSCTVSQRTHSIIGPFELRSGNDAHHVNVATFVPNDVDPAGNLTVSGGSCSGLAFDHGVLFSTPNPDGSVSTGNPCYGFDKARQFVNPRVDSNLRLDSTRKIDLEQIAVRAPNCHTNDNIIAIRRIHATLRVGSGGVPASDPVRAGPTSADIQKAFATSDLLTSLLRAQLPCGYVGLGLGTSLWASTVGGPTAPAALVPAYVLISYGEPLCIAYAKRIVDDISIANDPPVGSLNTIAKPKPTPSGAAAAARLASCDSQPADQQAFCGQLRGAAGNEIAAADKVASIADALLATVDRESKARRQHNAKALKRQDNAGGRLLAQLQSASLAEDQTWRAIAQLLSAQQLTGRFTASQDAAGISSLLKRLKAGGVSAAAVKRLAPSTLDPNPVDLVAN